MSTKPRGITVKLIIKLSAESTEVLAVETDRLRKHLVNYLPKMGFEFSTLRSKRDSIVAEYRNAGGTTIQLQIS